MTDKTETGAVEAVKTANAQAKADAAKATERAEARQKAVVEKAKDAKPKAYTSTGPVYADNRYYREGEVFVTSQPKGENWTERKPAEVSAIEASINLIPNDANLDEASVEALQAVAIIKHVSIVGIAKDKAALITAIKAANEPSL